MTPVDWGLALAITVAAAWVQGTIGFGFAIVSVPLLSLLDPTLVPTPQLLLMLPLTLILALRERASVMWGGLLWVMVGRVPGLLLGGWLLVRGDPALLDGVLGALVLAAALMLAWGLPVTRNPWTEVLAGTFAGCSSMVSAIGGPPIALLYRNERGPALRSTLSAIFLVGVLVTLCGRGVAGKVSLMDLRVAAVLVPAGAVGLLTSRWTRGRLEGPWLRRMVLALATLASLGLMLRGAWRAGWLPAVS